MPRVTLLYRQSTGLGIHVQENSQGLVVFGSPAVRPDWFEITDISPMEVENRRRLHDFQRINSVNNVTVQTPTELFALILNLVEEHQKQNSGSIVVALDFECGFNFTNTVCIPSADEWEQC